MRSLRLAYKNAINLRKSNLKEKAWDNLQVAVQSRNSKLFWNTINAPFLQTGENNIAQGVIEEDVWVSHFSKIYSQEEDTSLVSSFPLLASCPVLLFTPLETSKAITALTANKAPGPDGVPGDVYKSEPLVWGPLLTNIVNAAAIEGVPEAWGLSTIIPIFKKGDKTSPTCYRPISLLNSVIKVVGVMF